MKTATVLYLQMRRNSDGKLRASPGSVLHFAPVFVAQMLTYLRLTGLRRGLILNFNRAVLKAGIKRVTRFD